MGAKYYNKDQINELLEKSKGDPLETVILPTLFYGLRRSETLGLKWDSVDFLNKTVTIKHTVVKGSHEIYKTEATKNNSSYRTLPMSDIVFKALKRLKK